MSGEKYQHMQKAKKMSFDYNLSLSIFILEADVQELANHTLRIVVHKDIKQDRHEQN